MKRNFIKTLKTNFWQRCSHRYCFKRWARQTETTKDNNWICRGLGIPIVMWLVSILSSVLHSGPYRIFPIYVHHRVLNIAKSRWKTSLGCLDLLGLLLCGGFAMDTRWAVEWPLGWHMQRVVGNLGWAALAGGNLVLLTSSFGLHDFRCNMGAHHWRIACLTPSGE